PGLELPAPLAHEDRPAGDDVAVEPLDAEALCRAVAPVARASLTLLRCHCLVLVGTALRAVRIPSRPYSEPSVLRAVRAPSRPCSGRPCSEPSACSSRLAGV